MIRIIYTAHAQRRIRQRHVTRRMVEQTLSVPDHPYRRGNVADEEIAERRFGNRIVQVVFEERKTGELIVITVKAATRR